MDGIILIDKPEGWTSHDVVARVRRLLGERRVGHTGTLDPFATGVLVVLIGRATRLAQFLAGAEKEYEAVIRLGYATGTGDVTGAPLLPADPAHLITDNSSRWSDAQVEAAVAGLRGQIEQVPPMYSAKKVKGRKLYELARQGETVERTSVRVTIREFEVVRRRKRPDGPRDAAGRSSGSLLQQNAGGTCDLTVRVVCSAGTYIRVLAEAVGERLGTGAHLGALRRTRAGLFRLEDAVELDALSVMSEAGTVTGAVITPDAALSWMPFVHLTNEDARRVGHGAPLRVEAPEWNEGEHVRLRDGAGRLIAVGVYRADERRLAPRVVMS